MPCDVLRDAHDVVDAGRVVAPLREHLERGVEEPAHRPPTLRAQLALLRRACPEVASGSRMPSRDLYDSATRSPTRRSPVGGSPTGDLRMLAVTLREAARRFAELPAYVTPPGWSLTYTDLDRLSDGGGGRRSRGRGVGPGDVVSLVLPPGPEYLASYLAVAKLGAITAGVNDRLTPTERAGVLELAEPRLVLAAPGFAPETHEAIEVAAAESAPRPCSPSWSGPAPATAAPLPLPDDPERPVAIIFTSGTTGLPKGALYCNRQLSFITHNDVGDTWGARRSRLQRHVVRAPRLHDQAPRQRSGAAASRSSCGAGRHGGALELLSEQRMTTVAGVPTQLALMLRRPRLRRLRPRQRAVHRRRRRADLAGPRARRRGRASTPSSRRGTRARKPASGSAPGSTIPKRTRW